MCHVQQVHLNKGEVLSALLFVLLISLLELYLLTVMINYKTRIKIQHASVLMGITLLIHMRLTQC